MEIGEDRVAGVIVDNQLKRVTSLVHKNVFVIYRVIIQI